MNHIYKITGLILVLLYVNTGFSQSDFFKEVNAKGLPQPVEAVANVDNYRIFELDEAAIRKYLQDAPLEFQNNGKTLPLEIPLPNGKTETFGMVESPILSPEVAAKHPEIKTYTGNGLTNKKYIIRLSLTSSGFNAILLNVENDAVYFQPYTKEQSNLYFNYFGKDARAPKGGFKNRSCGLHAEEKEDYHAPTEELSALTGENLRTFRLAVACTAEFTALYGGTAIDGFNAIVGYVNRMNAVYRNELSVHFTLVSDETIAYTNAGSDPYTNSDQGDMLDENQANLDSEIGSANYDIGHVLNFVGSSGGGVAIFESVCEADYKAQGVSGEGEAPWVQIFFDQAFFHEVGHQFGMSHSYNSVIPVCTTRNPSTSVEPGAGATIMSYGFTCDEDDYFSSTTMGPVLNFHTANYSQAIAFIATICASSTATGNTAPVVTVPSNITIPKSTPFSLAGSATDADEDELTYSWEGTNIGTSVPDATTLDDTTEPPFFRSYEPASSGTRNFPILSSILDGSNQAKGDKLPSIGIATTHRLTVRDNNAAGGGVTFSTVTVTTDNSSGPFLVTAPNTTVGWMIGSTKTVTWDVANTTSAPISCANVDILLSLDGGQTFPITLASNVANDGSQDVVVPNNPTTTARIKVKCSTSIFFDINNANVVINATGVVTCDDTAVVLTCGESYNGDTNSGTNNFSSYTCYAFDESGKEIVHKIVTTSTGDITATLSNTFEGDVDVLILTDCSSSASCIAAGDVTAVAAAQPAGTYYIIVDGYNGDASSYTLTVTANCDTGGGDCDTPPPASGTITAETYQVSGAMTTGGQVLSASTVILKAGTSITLTTGFIAQAGSTFQASIEACEELEEVVAARSEEEQALTELGAEELTVFPNPFTEQAIIAYRITEPTTLSIEIYDINGRKIAQPVNNSVQSPGEHQLTFSAEGRPKGVYVVLLRTTNAVISRRLVLAE